MKICNIVEDFASLWALLACAREAAKRSGLPEERAVFSFLVRSCHDGERPDIYAAFAAMLLYQSVEDTILLKRIAEGIPDDLIEEGVADIKTLYPHCQKLWAAFNDFVAEGGGNIQQTGHCDG